MDSTSSHSSCVLESKELRCLAGDEAVSVLKCIICWEFYVDPVVLACGHTFCFRCLFQMAMHAKQNNCRVPVHTIFIGCPNCRRPIYISAILSHKLTHNYPLASFLESLRQRQLPKVDMVTRETNTEPPEPTKPEKEEENIYEESEANRNQYDYDEQKLNVLTSNLDLVLRTLTATNSVLGDLSCAPENQHLPDFHIGSEVQSNQRRSRRRPRASRPPACRHDRSIDELCSSLQRANFGVEPESEGTEYHPSIHVPNTSIPVSSLFGGSREPFVSGVPETTLQDPAILSFAIDSQQNPNIHTGDHFPPVGLYTFPGFGQV
ncbi:E3 ubiquitin-protein ligase TRIM4-like [Liolophura sinensis]|uniref:E3 ubiquitin-protein ligase TRIM4-like n=1 Tax=Liolophura sinensis TaxID=3198878 RepID=UPI003159925D